MVVEGSYLILKLELQPKIIHKVFRNTILETLKNLIKHLIILNIPYQFEKNPQKTLSLYNHFQIKFKQSLKILINPKKS